ncbi:cysteine desulfurase [candidate division KSB1 bacterium]|nr:cysteine desulfurase [candidate division KSB1 bacterium]
MSEAQFQIKNKNILRNLDPYKLRQDFPLISKKLEGKKYNSNNGHLVYLDNAATTQKPNAVIRALMNYYENDNANVHRALYELGDRATQKYEESRKTVAQFINAKHAREIVFTRGATEAINLVASAWGRKHLQAGDEIILTEMEHHSNLIPWQLLAKEKKLTLRFIPFLNNGTLNFSRVKSLFNERTRLVAMTHMSNVFGTINPVRGLIRMAHSRCIPVLLDGAQSVPHIPVDVQYLDCDFLAFSGHKMCGPTGIGVLYGKQEYLDAMDPYQGGGDMISSVWLEKATWNEIPYKFEAGTPNIAGAIGLAAAIRYINEIGMEKITRYEQALTTYAILEMNKLPGIRFYGIAPERGGVISFSLDNIHPHDMAQFLDSQGIAVRAGHHCAQPIMRKLEIPATTRASLYFYNTFEEIDLLVAALKKAKEFFN